MTQELKDELHKNMTQLGEMMYQKTLEAAEQAESVFPEAFDEKLKAKVISQVITSTFAAQKDAMEKGFADVSKHLQDKDYMQGVIDNVRQS